MKKFITILLFALLLMSESLVAQAVNVSPAIIRFSSSPGAAQSERILLINDDKKPQVLQILIGDWRRKTDGQHEYFEPGTLDESCSKWLKISSNIIEVPGEGTAELTITIDPPSDYNSDEMKWAMLFIRGVVEKAAPLSPENTLSTTIEETFQFGVHVYNTPVGVTQTSAQIKKITPIPDSQSFLLNVENTGKTQIKGEAFMILTHKSSGEEFEILPIEAPIFPGYFRDFTLTVPDSLPGGEYDMLGLFDYGENYEMEGIQVDFTKP